MIMYNYNGINNYYQFGINLDLVEKTIKLKINYFHFNLFSDRSAVLNNLPNR